MKRKLLGKLNKSMYCDQPIYSDDIDGFNPDQDTEECEHEDFYGLDNDLYEPCQHDNLRTTDVMPEPNMGVAICPNCGVIIKVVVEAYDPEKHDKKVIETSFTTNPQPIEKLSFDKNTNFSWFENIEDKINEIIDYLERQE